LRSYEAKQSIYAHLFTIKKNIFFYITAKKTHFKMVLNVTCQFICYVIYKVGLYLKCYHVSSSINSYYLFRRDVAIGKQTH